METRERGYSVDEGECDEEVRCVAAPIYDITGRCVAAISISAPEFRMHKSAQNEAGKLVMEAAHEISSAHVAWNQEGAQNNSGPGRQTTQLSGRSVGALPQ